MGLGILKDNVMEHVPGTTQYFEDPSQPPPYSRDNTTGLKCDTSGPVPIILVPQPSDDPNDPLNWPLWKRDMITFILSLTAIFATALGPILAANTFTLVAWFHVTFTDVALLTGYFLLGVGLAGFVFVPSSRIWGKRHTFIIGGFIVVISSVWTGVSQRNYTSMLWSRIFQGVGAAPFEALVNAAVGDLYFVHQRGMRMAFTNLAVFGGAFFTPILVGKITHTITWQWTFYLVAIFTAVGLVAIIFLCPETAYVRDHRLNLDMLSSDEAPMGLEASINGAEGQKSPASTDGHPTNGVHGSSDAETMAPRHSPYDPLRLFNGRKTDEKFWKLLLRPLPLFLQPAFVWASLIQGTLIGWTVFIGVILAKFFTLPPLFWNEVGVGYTYTSAFIGALLGFLIAGLLADWSAKVLTRWNGGVYEPEFRIFLTIPQLVLGCMGLYGWGITIDGMAEGWLNYAVPLVFFGLEVAGMVIGAVASSLYIVDAYRELSIEGFTCMIIFKNFFSFALTFKGFDWLGLNQSKATHLFVIIGSVQVAICLLSIPMYVFGKRIRSFFHRHDLLEIFKLR